MQENIRQDIDLLEATTRPAKLETTPLPYGVRDLDHLGVQRPGLRQSLHLADHNPARVAGRHRHGQDFEEGLQPRVQ